jgi:hypothetical protein
MDFDIACDLILRQTIAPQAGMNDTFLLQLRQGKPPVPGQVTSLLLALKAAYEGLRHETVLDRQLVQALFALAYESRQLYNAGRHAGVNWPPLLDDDLKRIATAVQAIVADRWP